MKEVNLTELSLTFIFGGVIMLAIYYSANILKNGVLSAIISLIPLSIISCYVILNREIMINHNENLIPVLLITIAAVILLILLLKHTNLNMYYSVSIALVFWALIQYLRAVFYPV
jgi:FtsH-binding integral membrane protein